MTRLLLFSLVLFATTIRTYAQQYEKITVEPADSTSGYYLAVKPQSGNIEGVLLLLGGTGMAAEDIFPETRLHNVAYTNSLLTVAVSIGPRFYADTATISRLSAICGDVVQRYNASPAKFVLGGFSGGGTIALRYTEMCRQNPAGMPIQPAAVFAIDAPVDLLCIYEYAKREIEKNFSDAGVGEAKYIKAVLEKEIGDPLAAADKYAALSPFSMKAPGNESYLKNIPVRTYHDMDVAWQLQQRRRGLLDMNALPASEMINRLLLLGNKEAEFIAGRTGYRNNGMRHPHAMSIVDEVECINWVKDKLHIFNPFTFRPPYYLPVAAKWGQKYFPSGGDMATFTGSIHMLDYMGQQPVVLHAIVHVKQCEADERTAVFFELSPREAGHAVWREMGKIWEGFRCRD